MVDHQDSFVHNLASYFRRCGVDLITLRPEMARDYLQRQQVDLLVLSPGPATPAQFDMSRTIELALQRDLSIFGVCLGLQGIVEYFGGELVELGYPMHGKPSRIRHQDSDMFAGIECEFSAGRYHSLIANSVPDCLRVTAKTVENNSGKLSSQAPLVMAVEHESLPIRAVQFHPESIMSLENNCGYRLIKNVVAEVVTGIANSN
jgi:anthranilate synthase